MTKQKLYYKITNAEENHHGFQYQDGLNILKEKFNDNPNDHCVPGGFYFTDVEHIFEFICYGIYVREITLPLNDPAFKMVADENKYRANMIILGERHELSKLATIKMLVERGADIAANNYYILLDSARNGCLDTVKYLTNNTIPDYAINNALLPAVDNGHLDTVKYLMENGAKNISTIPVALKWAAKRGYLGVVKYIMTHGPYDCITMNRALQSSVKNSKSNEDGSSSFSSLPFRGQGHMKVVKYLIESGADLHDDNDAPLRWAATRGYLEIVKYLVEKGADIHANKDEPLRDSAQNRHIEVVKYLVEKGADIDASHVLALLGDKNSHIDVVKYLLDKQMAIEQRKKIEH